MPDFFATMSIEELCMLVLGGFMIVALATLCVFSNPSIRSENEDRF